MADASVIDELIVRLRLDAEEYKKAEKKVSEQVDRTEKKAKDRDVKSKRRDDEQKKRWRSLTTEAKAFTKTMGAVVLAVAGLGAAVVGSLTSLNAFELGLRRQGVSTGLSNRELQAWGSTARRLGADADAGADAVANLAKEQKQFRLTGQAPTLQAFARAGVNVSPGMPIPDILANAQQVYRGAAPAQREQLEATLSAQGVSPDLILMIKSEKDAREEYTRSLAEASTENRKALDAMSDALAAAKNNAISMANSLATVLQPVTERAAQWLSRAAVQASDFADKVMEAGGGVDGFMKVVNRESPALGATLRGLGDALDGVAQVVDVVAFGLKELYEVLKSAVDWFNNTVTPHVNPEFKAGISNAWEWTKNLWRDTVSNARANGPAPAQATIDWINAPPAKTTAPAPGQAAPTDALALTRKLVENGLSVPQAAAVVANWEGESSLNPASVNTAGGGTGARGLANWRGDRTAAFVSRFGVTPDKATVDQQIAFMLNDPYEKSKLAESFAGGGGARSLGAAYSRIYEAHGNAATDALRGQRAAELAAQYRLSGGPMGPANGSTDNGGNTFAIQSMTVMANNPGELANGITRNSNVQSYNSAVR